MPALGPKAGAVDQGLRVLDAEADGEGLGFDIDAGLVQHLEGVAGAVADGQDDMFGSAMRFAAGQFDAAT